MQHQHVKKKKSFTHACRLLLQVKCLTCVKPAWLTQGSKSQGDTISNWIVRGCWPIRSGHRLSEVLQATCDMFYKLQLWLNPKTSKLKLPFFWGIFCYKCWYILTIVLLFLIYRKTFQFTRNFFYFYLALLSASLSLVVVFAAKSLQNRTSLPLSPCVYENTGFQEPTANLYLVQAV